MIHWLKMEGKTMKFHNHPAIYVSNIHLKVSDIQQSIDFYTHVLCFQVEKVSEKVAHVKGKGNRTLVILEEISPAKRLDPRHTGLYHVAFLLPERHDLANFLAHIEKQRYRIIGAADHLVSEAIYLSDPDGNGIEVYVDRPSKNWKWSGEEVDMATLSLDINGLMEQAILTDRFSMPKDTIIGHIHLQVNDLQEAEHFYKEVLGFNIVNRFGRQALFMSTERYHHHIGLNTWNSLGGKKPDENQVGMKSYTLHVPEEEREIIVKRLKNLQFAVKRDKEMYCVEDPASNQIRF